MHFKRFCCAAALCALVSLTGCALLPEEQNVRAVPVVKKTQIEPFKTVACAREDLALTEKINAYYVPAQTVSLCFQAVGCPVDSVFVQTGDKVSAGDLLAKLDSADAEDDLSDARFAYESALLQQKHLKEKHALSPEADFESQSREIEDKLTVAQMRIDQAQAALDARSIVSPMDGTVTFVKKFTAESRSLPDEQVIRIADYSVTLFRAETEYASHFSEGTPVTITSKKTDYTAKAVSAQTLGISEKENTVYFMLDAPAPELEDGDRGTLLLTLDAREDALCIPKRAVSTINGQAVVFVQDENGYRAYKNVEIGLEADDGKLEILSGLEEGEIVIAD